MEIEKLKEFACLAKTLNYRMAARQCYIGQSTLSKHILALEKELGCKLLDRTKANVSLTPFGEILLQHADAILGEYEKCLNRIDYAKDPGLRNLSIGYTHAAAHKLLSEFYRFMRARCKNLNLNLNFKQLQFDIIKAQLDDDVVDIVIDVSPDYDDALYDRLPIYSDCLVAIVPSTHPFAQYENIPIGELQGQTLLAPKLSQESFRSPFMENAFGQGFLDKVNLVPAYSAATEIPWYISNGAGIAVAGGFVYEDARSHDLVSIPLEGTNLDYNVCAIWKKQNENPAIKDCIAALAELTKTEAFRSCLPPTAREPF